MLAPTRHRIFRISKCIQQYFSSADEQVLGTLDLPNPSNTADIFKYVSSRCKHFTITDKNLKSQREWMKECIPALKKNTDQIIKNQMIGDLFLYYLRIKLNWNDLINIGLKCLTDKEFKNINLTQLVHVYGTLVELRYDRDLNFVARIRSVIQQKMENLSDIEYKDVRNFLKFLQLVILDKNIKKEQKNSLICRIVQKCVANPQNLSNISSLKEDNISLLSSLYEQVKIYGIQMHESLLNIFQTANNEIDQYLKNNPKKLRSMSKFFRQDQNKSKIMDQSIFQIMFEKNLREAGYNYNVFHIIKGNQYDFLIKSKNKHKFCPLKSIDLNMSINKIQEQNKKNWKPFSKVLLKELNECEEQQYLKKTENLEQKVIINLNGPHHYIDSDILPKNSICRKQEFKSQKLQLYGNYRFNSVNYQQWERTSRYDQLAWTYIQQIIKEAKTFKKSNSL